MSILQSQRLLLHQFTLCLSLVFLKQTENTEQLYSFTISLFKNNALNCSSVIWFFIFSCTIIIGATFTLFLSTPFLNSDFQDNIGVLVDQNGKLLQEGRICWSEAPSVVVIQKPYATALLPRHIEVFRHFTLPTWVLILINFI